ncbi:MAG: terminus macrodomain insulation protein YfbV [Plesiomonas sp.]|uniref:terminus macrodomain insulation protein YfbV n=1 Tax=Plesiomonas sp. TaxID=2486279 RepID=UPI003F2F9FF1
MSDVNPGWMQLLRDGQTYMNLWPVEKRLAIIFPEPRIIKTTKFAQRFMPALAVFSVAWQMSVGGGDNMAIAVIVALFSLSLPLQGLWWLGKRANTRLPPSLTQWYRDIYHKMQAGGMALLPVAGNPRYQELADLLNRALKKPEWQILDEL